MRLFSDLKSDFTFSPRSPISPCWERKQSIKGREADGGVEVGAATQGQIISGV